MRSFVKKSLGVITFAALAGGFGVYWFKTHHDAKSSYRTAAVKRGDVTTSISASGTIEPEEVVDVGAQVAGLIKSFGTDTQGHSINYGSVVEEGAILARIDESVYAADLAVAKAQLTRDEAGELSSSANLEQTRARFNQTDAAWKRAQELFSSKLVSAVDYDTDKANYEIAKANVSVAEAAVAQARASTVQSTAGLQKAQRNLDFCVIKSPIKGVVIDRRVNIGQTVVASLNAPSLFLIAKDLKKMQIWVSVNEADVVRIVPGASVTFACDAFPNRQFNGTVGRVRLNATMTQNVVMYTVEVNAENPDNALLPYLTANVRFIVRKEADVLTVPNAALRWSPSSITQIAPDARNNSPTEDESTGEGKSSKKKKKGKDRGSVIWIPNGEFVRPVGVNAGISDGTTTAVSGEGLQEGQMVVVGEVSSGAKTTSQNPFQPPTIKR